jgi:hypothetical protein
MRAYPYTRDKSGIRKGAYLHKSSQEEGAAIETNGEIGMEPVDHLVEYYETDHPHFPAGLL